MTYRRNVLFALTAAATLVACGDDTPTDPIDGEQNAAVEGRVEQTAPSSASGSALRASSAGSAETVAVGRIEADGSFTSMAEADVQADGTYRVEGVATGQSDLAVVAYAQGQATGQVLLHERTRANAVITAAPINYETTVEGRAYGELKAMGKAGGAASSELALFVHMDGPEAQTVVSSDAEIRAIAESFVTAQAALERVYAEAGASLDATTRTDLMASAAAQFATARHAGTSLQAAHDAFVNAALDAYASAGATAESSVMATAAATSTFDAGLAASSSARAELIAEAVRMNLRARERFAAELEGSAHASLAAQVRSELEATRARIASASSSAEIRTSLEANADATADVVVTGVLDLLAVGADLIVRSDVEAKARTAIQTASLSARFRSATSAEAAAQAVASYRAEVRAAVDAMIEASGDTSADAEAMTSLFIAAQGSAYVR